MEMLITVVVVVVVERYHCFLVPKWVNLPVMPLGVIRDRDITGKYYTKYYIERGSRATKKAEKRMQSSTAAQHVFAQKFSFDMQWIPTEKFPEQSSSH